MKKIIVIAVMLNVLVYGDFMSSMEDMIKSGIGGEKKVHHFPKVETVGTLSNAGAENKDSSYFGDILDTVKEKTGLAKKKKKVKEEKKSTLTSIIDTVKDTVGLETKKKKDDSMFSSIISTAKSTMGLEKKKPDLFSIDGIKDTVLSTVGMAPKDTSILGTIKSSTSGVFSSAKNTGKTAELMSGISYKGTKLMNKGIKVFSDSPLNIFESKKEKSSASLGGVLDMGNSLLDMVDVD